MARAQSLRRAPIRWDAEARPRQGLVRVEAIRDQGRQDRDGAGHAEVDRATRAQGPAHAEGDADRDARSPGGEPPLAACGAPPLRRRPVTLMMPETPWAIRSKPGRCAYGP